MVPTTMTLDFDAPSSTVTGNGVISIILVNVNYTGTYTHPDFTLEGSYSFGLFGGQRFTTKPDPFLLARHGHTDSVHGFTGRYGGGFRLQRGGGQNPVMEEERFPVASPAKLTLHKLIFIAGRF